MPKKTTIERVHKIDGVNVSSPIDLSDEITQKKVEGNFPEMVFFAAKKDGFWHRAIQTTIETIAGENKVGKGIGQVKDAVSYLFPATKIFDMATDQVADMLKTKNINKKTGPMNWFINRLNEKTTWRGIVAVATGAGIAISPDQATAIVAVGVALAGLIEAFTKEPQSADAG